MTVNYVKPRFRQTVRLKALITTIGKNLKQKIKNKNKIRNTIAQHSTEAIAHIRQIDYY